MNPKPPVSILMPVYNAERHLDAAIDSILAQTYTDFELLIIDDGSTDKSLEIVRSYRDKRIRILAAPHQGLVATLNAGLSEARGAFVARMDADDLSTPRRIEKQVEYLHRRPDTALVGSWARLVDEAGEPTGTCWAEPIGGRHLYLGLCSSNQFIHGSTMFRRDAALAVGGYRAAFVTAEDYDLWLRLGEVGELANIPESLYLLRVHRRSKTAIEGARTVTEYTDRARHYALQRYLYGHDHLGYALSGGAPIQRGRKIDRPIGLATVTLSDRAQLALWEGNLRLSLVLFRRAVVCQPYRIAAWPIVPPKSFNRAYAREALAAAHKGAWAGLCSAKARRVARRIMERIYA